MEYSKEDDREFYQLMQKSNLNMPFSDFEDNMMDRIYQEARHRKFITNNIKLSTFFFIIGTLFGVIITTVLPKLEVNIFGISSNQFMLYFQIIFTILFLTQLESLIKLIRSQMKR